MTWSLQLTIWALPPLLAVLVVLRDLEYLWPRRREVGATALMALLLSSGLWALLALLAVISSRLEVKALLERAGYVPGALATVAWAAFATMYARGRKLTSWPLLLLYALSLFTIGVAVWEDPPGLLLRHTELTDLGGVSGLSVVYGPWHRVQVAVRTVAVVVSGIVLSGHLAERRARAAIGWVGLASVLAVGPTLAHLLLTPGDAWTNQTPTGFALGASVIVLGLMRRRLLDMGPIARTLVMDELPDPIVVLDGRGRIVDANRAAQSGLGLRPYGDVPVPLGTLWASSRPEPPEPATIDLEVEGATGAQRRTFEVRVTHLGERGRHSHSAILLRDITDRERMERDLLQASEALRGANQDLKRLANTDVLTGLANRRRFMEVLEAEIDRAQRYDRPLSLLLVDLDHFKDVNDTHGHTGGDEVLRAVADVLAAVCRDVDLAARIGGEEFAILLPETDARGAEHVAERARGRIAESHHRAPSGAGFRITASAGVASLGREVTSAEGLLQAADDALYRAKGEGRNRVVAAD
jgi:diguanylate cyclase (GGDEF)-like protein